MELQRLSDAGLSPTFIEMRDGRVEPALLTVAFGLGAALIPSSVGDRCLAPGVRLAPLYRLGPTVSRAVVTRRDSTHLPTAAFLRPVSQQDAPDEPVAAETPVQAAA
jgi:hypothetical protein